MKSCSPYSLLLFSNARTFFSHSLLSSSKLLLRSFLWVLFLFALFSFSNISNAESIDELRAKASNNNSQAQVSLAQAYIKGKEIKQNLKQARYWLIKAAVSGNIQAQYELGNLYNKDKNTSSQIQAETWYQIASENGHPKAEEAYARVLERLFNQRRARQVSSIQQLDQAYDETQASLEAPVSPPKDNVIRTDVMVILTILILVLLFTFIRRFRRTKKDNRVNDLKTRIAKQNKQISQLNRKQQTQHKQMGKMYDQLQKSQKQKQENGIAIACALLGYQPHKLPNERALKARYKKLCRVYHPDADGSDEEMKRLNAAVKIVSKYQKSAIH